MKRQYIDFVPSKNRPVAQETKKPVIRTIKVAFLEEEEPIVEEEPIIEETMVPEATVEDFLKEPEVLDENLFAPKSAAALGVIEDYSPIEEEKRVPKMAPKAPVFKAANVEKRPLSTPHRFVSKRAMQDVKAAKAEKVAKKPLDLTKKPVEKPAPKKETEDFKTPFVNRNVEKRPLSKTVYPKKQSAPVYEEPSAPVTIINKPEKDANVSLVVAILLTIILGAAVGTVAFLLLPR